MSGGHFENRIAVVCLTITLAVTGAAFAQNGTGPVSTAAELFGELNLDPAKIHSPLIPTLEELADTASHPANFKEFFQVLSHHATRYGEDDNFTLRVVHNPTKEVLERYVLEKERSAFLQKGSANWDTIDKRRRKVMKTLLDKFERAGYRRRDLTVTWGRLNQVFEARARDEPYLEYELKLAGAYGLSALATELSTVETFNQDWLVSKAGARGRYQFMPDLLRRFGIRRFSLKTTSGRRVRVYEERHPLITMEHAFVVMRAYSNAVGHELPGLSAYNTGVGNIFTVCRLFLINERPNPDDVTVFDAYAWALTDGFSVVRRRSTFRRQSRAYVPSVLAAYRAVENMPIDFSRTMHAEFVTMAKRKRVNLKDVLAALDKHDLDWTPWEDASSYQAFLSFNGHLTLPAAKEDGGMPSNGNFVMTNNSDKLRLRIFLPIGATEVLKEAGIDVFEDELTRYFDEETYADPATTGDKSLLDWEYEALVDDIGNFEFTLENRERLEMITDRMAKLAEDNPSQYRKAQATISSMHNRLWAYGPWVKLEKAVAQARNTYEAQLKQGEIGTSGIGDR